MCSERMHTGERYNGSTNGRQQGGRVTKGWTRRGETLQYSNPKQREQTLANWCPRRDHIWRRHHKRVHKGPILQEGDWEDGDTPSFKTGNKIIYTKNRGGEDIICVPSAMLAEMTLKTRILDQAHQVVGHYGPQRTSDYIRRWYWWLHIYTDTEKFCKLCEICAQAKGEYQKPAGKLHLLPIATRPWESIGMDFIGPFLEGKRI